MCKSCSYYDIPTICKEYLKEECKTTKRFPYTCHSYQRKSVCILDRYFYNPNKEQKEIIKIFNHLESTLEKETFM